MAIKDSYRSLAALLEGNTRNPFARKKNPHSEALRDAAELYRRLEYVAAYKGLKPAHEKVVADMQRLLARNPDFEANKLVKEQQKPLAAAKETVQKLRVHAQVVIDQFDDLLQDLESKPIVRAYLEKGEEESAVSPAITEAPETTLSSAAETRVAAKSKPSDEIVIASQRYIKSSYLPPAKDALYVVRDKSKGERVIRIQVVSDDGAHVQVEPIAQGHKSGKSVKLAVESLARQAEKGWCKLLVPLSDDESTPAVGNLPLASDQIANAIMRLDIQNFGRCIADIARANIKFDTQLIKDIGDGPFRAGNYEQAFLLFEQSALTFASAVANSRREIADGRRILSEQKANLSGKEIQDRIAAFVRTEHLIHTAEREVSTILEGLRMYLRVQQNSSRAGAAESKS